ncbi:MAG: trigger factor [Legionellales bacterium]|nr:trigger factor [Legionellales bacterium]
MQVSVETVQGLERRMTVAIPAEQITEKIEERLHELQKKAQIKGFRPGKVPARVVKSRFGESVRYEVLDEIMRDSLNKALNEQSITPAGMPKIESTTAEEGKPLEYVVSFEVFPEFTLTSLKNNEITQKKVEISSDDMQEAMQKLQQQHADWVEVERGAANNDKIVIDFVGKIDGEAFEGGTAVEFELELGKNSMIPGFEEPLLGMKAGEERDINVTFPENYHHQDLAGKPTVFSIKLHKVLEAQLPTLDDAFAEKLGVENKTLAGLQEELKKLLEEQIDIRIKADIKGKVLDKLVELNPIDIPRALIRAEVDALKQRSVNQMRGKIDINQLPDALFEAESKKRVHIALLLRQVITDYAIKLDQDRLNRHVDLMVSNYPQPERVKQLIYTTEALLNEAQTAVLEEQAVEKLLEEATVTYEVTSYTEFTKQAQVDDHHLDHDHVHDENCQH